MSALRDRSGRHHIKGWLEGCTLHTHQSWDGIALEVDTAMPLHLLAGPEDWFEDSQSSVLPDRMLLRIPFRRERMEDITADIAAWQAAYDAARETLGQTYPDTLEDGPTLDIIGAHAPMWTPMAEDILARFDGRLADAFVSVITNDVGHGPQIVDVRMNAPAAFFIDRADLPVFERVFGGFQKLHCSH